MDATEASQYSLADFHTGDSDDPLRPPPEYQEWRSAVTWATSLYERSLLGPAVPRTAIDAQGSRKPVLNFASYNYLGLANHPETIAAAKAALDSHGTGACGSPILSGMTDLHRALERRLSEFLGRESTMLFNSGFGGALGSLSGLLRKGDVAVADSKVHISLIEGAKLSGAAILMFDHNDPDSLDKALTKSKGRRRLVVIEGIYSMDGDIGDLPSLLEVTERHGVGMMIDEAHSILAMGAGGRGIAEHFGIEHRRIGLQYATFSKAFAAAGGFVSGTAETLDYLRYYASPYGFSCALPPPVVGAILKGLEVATRDASLRLKLRENADYFRKQLHSLGLDTGTSTTHVVPIIIGSNRSLLYMLGYAMLARGLYLAPVDYPSVPDDQVRFRASITAAHTREDLDEALNIIESTIVPALGAAAA
ncbi:MAG: aminotransferase class I/II-fold pyridoxal phosphate-dependent enzyme [Polyangiaceae bacterium]|nr:aminotransferase class I/II-fold pyridoxal phosphate-dependent enzyme [Polyangiaceae bacterium]